MSRTLILLLGACLAAACKRSEPEGDQPRPIKLHNLERLAGTWVVEVDKLKKLDRRLRNTLDTVLATRFGAMTFDFTDTEVRISGAPDHALASAFSVALEDRNRLVLDTPSRRLDLEFSDRNHMILTMNDAGKTTLPLTRRVLVR